MPFGSDFMSNIDHTPIHTSSFHSADTGINSPLSAYDPFTEASPRLTLTNLTLNLDFAAIAGSYPAEPISSPYSMSRYMCGPVDSVFKHLFFDDDIPTIPDNLGRILSSDYDHILEANTAPKHSQRSPNLANPGLSPMPIISLQSTKDLTSGILIQTHSLPEFDVAVPSSSMLPATENLTSFSSLKSLDSSDIEVIDFGEGTQSPMGWHNPQDSYFQGRLWTHDDKMHLQNRPNTSELQIAQMRQPEKGPSPSDGATVTVVRVAPCKCNYPHCNKSFRRKEHLKRHKQTFHGEGPNRFSCEFCGKGHFNRLDNLNNHRKLHARRNGKSRGVGFIPAAVNVIAQEDRSRKRYGLK